MLVVFQYQYVSCAAPISESLFYIDSNCKENKELLCHFNFLNQEVNFPRFSTQGSQTAGFEATNHMNNEIIDTGLRETHMAFLCWEFFKCE